MDCNSITQQLVSLWIITVRLYNVLCMLPTGDLYQTARVGHSELGAWSDPGLALIPGTSVEPGNIFASADDVIRFGDHPQTPLVHSGQAEFGAHGAVLPYVNQASYQLPYMLNEHMNPNPSHGMQTAAPVVLEFLEPPPEWLANFCYQRWYVPGHLVNQEPVQSQSHASLSDHLVGVSHGNNFFYPHTGPPLVFPAHQPGVSLPSNHQFAISPHLIHQSSYLPGEVEVGHSPLTSTFRSSHGLGMYQPAGTEASGQCSHFEQWHGSHESSPEMRPQIYQVQPQFEFESNRLPEEARQEIGSLRQPEGFNTETNYHTFTRPEITFPNEHEKGSGAGEKHDASDEKDSGSDVETKSLDEDFVKHVTKDENDFNSHDVPSALPEAQKSPQIENAPSQSTHSPLNLIPKIIPHKDFKLEREEPLTDAVKDAKLRITNLKPRTTELGSSFSSKEEPDSQSAENENREAELVDHGENKEVDTGPKIPLAPSIETLEGRNLQISSASIINAQKPGEPLNKKTIYPVPNEPMQQAQTLQMHQVLKNKSLNEEGMIQNSQKDSSDADIDGKGELEVITNEHTQNQLHKENIENLGPKDKESSISIESNFNDSGTESKPPGPEIKLFKDDEFPPLLSSSEKHIKFPNQSSSLKGSPQISKKLEKSKDIIPKYAKEISEVDTSRKIKIKMNSILPKQNSSFVKRPKTHTVAKIKDSDTRDLNLNILSQSSNTKFQNLESSIPNPEALNLSFFKEGSLTRAEDNMNSNQAKSTQHKSSFKISESLPPRTIPVNFGTMKNNQALLRMGNFDQKTPNKPSFHSISDSRTSKDPSKALVIKTPTESSIQFAFAKKSGEMAIRENELKDTENDTLEIKKQNTGERNLTNIITGKIGKEQRMKTQKTKGSKSIIPPENDLEYHENVLGKVVEEIKERASDFKQEPNEKKEIEETKPKHQKHTSTGLKAGGKVWKKKPDQVHLERKNHGDRDESTSQGSISNQVSTSSEIQKDFLNDAAESLSGNSQNNLKKNLNSLKQEEKDEKLDSKEKPIKTDRYIKTSKKILNGLESQKPKYDTKFESPSYIETEKIPIHHKNKLKKGIEEKSVNLPKKKLHILDIKGLGKFCDKSTGISLEEAFGSSGGRISTVSVQGMDKINSNSKEVLDYQIKNHGELNALDWEKNGLDLHLMNFLAKHFTIYDKTPHQELDKFLDILAYNWLKKIWETDRMRFINAENWFLEYFGKFEGIRRIFAFHHQLKLLTITCNFKTQKEASLKNRISQDLISDIEKVYSISEDPLHLTQIPVVAPGLEISLKMKIGTNEQLMNSISNSIFGKKEKRFRKEFISYCKNRSNPHIWWDPHKLGNAALLLGVDKFTVIKVGDSLQFGSQLMLTHGMGRISIDSATLQLLKIMTDRTRHLPWIESPERKWVVENYNKIYQERIQSLSRIINGPDSNSSKYRHNTIKFVKENFGEELVENLQEDFGDILQWCDAGLEPNMMLKIIRNDIFSTSSPSEQYDIIKKMFESISTDQETAIKAWVYWKRQQRVQGSSQVTQYTQSLFEWKDWISTGFWAAIKGKLKKESI